jgi:glycosyltransferase involved in cell wall biosynthesis
MGRKMVLFVGRLTMQKGVDHFLKAAAIVVQHEPTTMFVIAGAGDMEHQLIREAATLGLTENILFVGFRRGEELHALYRDADLFVMPSVSEPFGLTALEAIAIGNAPVLLSKQSGASEVIKNALRVDFWDVDEMANQMVAALRFSPLRSELSKRSLRELPSVSWVKAALLLKSLYRKARNVARMAT